MGDAGIVLRQILTDRPHEAEAVFAAFQTRWASIRNSPKPIIRAALQLLESGQYETALAFLRLATRLKPDYVSAHRHMAEALRALGREEEAREAWRTAERLSPGE